MILFLQMRMLLWGSTYMHEEDFTRVPGVELSEGAVEDVILLFP
jgi:hypothetical protein